jgi:hypothetical protein
MFTQDEFKLLVLVMTVVILFFCCADPPILATFVLVTFCLLIVAGIMAICMKIFENPVMGCLGMVAMMPLGLVVAAKWIWPFCAGPLSISLTISFLDGGGKTK